MPFGLNDLVFEDNFTRLDKNVWSLRDAAQSSDDKVFGSWDAVSVSGEKLRLWSKPVGELFLNGHVGTESSFQFQYGYAEANMRFHPYLGSHAAFWLQTTNPYAVNRPEIDVAEYFGVQNPERKSPTNMWHCVYYRDDNEGPLLNWKDTTQDSLATRWSKYYHKYGVLWEPSGYTFYIDRVPVAQTTLGKSDTPKYLVLSMITRDYEIANYRRDQADTYKLSVESVRVWQ